MKTALIEPGWYVARWREGQRIVVVRVIICGDGPLCRNDVWGGGEWRMDRPLGAMDGPYNTRAAARRACYWRRKLNEPMA